MFALNLLLYARKKELPIMKVLDEIRVFCYYGLAAYAAGRCLSCTRAVGKFPMKGVLPMKKYIRKTIAVIAIVCILLMKFAIKAN